MAVQTAQKPALSKGALRHFELLQLATELVYEFSNQQAFQSRWGTNDSRILSTYDGLDRFSGKRIDPAPTHLLLDILEENVSGFRVPPGFHQMSIGHLREVLKFFEGGAGLGGLSAQVLAEHNKMLSLTPQEYAQEEQIKKAEITKEKKYERKRLVQQGGRLGVFFPLKPLPYGELEEAEEKGVGLGQRIEAATHKIPEGVKEFPGELAQRVELPIFKWIRRLPMTTIISAGMGGVFGLFRAGPAGALVGLLGGGWLGGRIKNIAERGGAAESEAPTFHGAPQPQQTFAPSGGAATQPTQAQGIPQEIAPPPPPAPPAPGASANPLAPVQQAFGAPFQISKYLWIGFFVLLLLLVVFFIPSSSPTTQPKPTTIATTTGGDVSQCTFFFRRKQDRKVGKSGISLLIADAANKVGIPASVLGGVITLETPTAITGDDASYITNDFDNHESDKHAIGVAKFMANTFKGTFEKYQSDISTKFGKASPDTTKIDTQWTTPPQDNIARIVSVKDSIILAAYEIKRLHDGVTTNPNLWDKDTVQVIAKGYQSGCDNGYCEDLWDSVQSCSTALAGGTHPTAPPTNLPLQQAIASEFNISVNDFDDQHLAWIRDKLWDVSATNWVQYLKGATIDARHGEYISYADSCNHIALGDKYTDPTPFKVLLIHEGGHIIDCREPDSLSRKTEIEQELLKEGPVTNYAKQACYPGDTTPNEDYAETIAYYLNPGVLQITTCAPTGPAPFSNGDFPLHYNTAKAILGEY